MAPHFDRLLESTILYLRELKQAGTAHVRVSSESMAWLIRPPPIAEGAPAVLTAAPVPVAGAPGVGAPSPGNAPPLVHDAALQGEDKISAFAQLQQRALVCVKCPQLAATRKNVVFGVGSIDAQLMFVGEAPGADEDAAGEPFVGRAGQLLTRIIETMGFTRQTVYIANILKCRPDTPGQAYGNRKPTSDEMKTCLPYLLAQINLIRPRVMVALGVTAMEGLFGGSMSISRARGKWHEFQGIPVMPTFHPAYLLRDQSLGERRKVWEDMLQVLDRLGGNITEKQRNYFQ